MPVAQQFGETPLEMLVLVAQHFHLPFLQRHRRLCRAGSKAGCVREHFRVFGEKIGVGEQVFGDFAIVHGFGLIEDYMT